MKLFQIAFENIEYISLSTLDDFINGKPQFEGFEVLFTP